MKVNDHQDGQSLCHVEPEEPFHRRSLTSAGASLKD
jgi:hypothetical protein